MMNDRTDYEHTTIDSAIVVDGGIMPLRTTDPGAGIDAKRCLRGEDIAFLHERRQEIRVASGLDPETRFVGKVIDGSAWRDVADVQTLVSDLRPFVKTDVGAEGYVPPDRYADISGIPGLFADDTSGRERARLLIESQGLGVFEAGDFVDVKASFAGGRQFSQSAVESVFANYAMPRYYGVWDQYNWGSLDPHPSSFSGTAYEYHVAGSANWLLPGDLLVHAAGRYVGQYRAVRTSVSAPAPTVGIEQRNCFGIGQFYIVSDLGSGGENNLQFSHVVSLASDGRPASVSELIELCRSYYFSRGGRFEMWSGDGTGETAWFGLFGIARICELREKTFWA